MVMVVAEFLDTVTLGTNCVVVAMLIACVLAGYIAVDGSYFVDDSELFK